MKENTLIKNDKTEDIQMMTDFKDELERIKQKLAKDFSKYSELENMKNKQKLAGRALIFRKTSTPTNIPKEINDITNMNDS
jgi:SOS response regulatory protein OraA/RecX